MKLLKFFILFSIITISLESFAAKNCPNDRRQSMVKPSAEQVSKVVCKAAEDDKIPATPARGWFSMCGFGGGEGYSKAWENVKSVGSAVLAAPGYIYGKGKDVVSSAYNGARNYFSGSDPAKKLQQQAGQDAQASRGFLQVLKDKAEILNLLGTELWKNLKYNAELSGTTISCLPWDWKMQYICGGIAEIGPELLSGGTIAQTGRKSVEIASAVAKYSKDTKLVSEIGNLSLSQRLAAGAEALKNSSQMQLFLRTPDANIMTRVDAITGQPRYFLEKYAVVNGKRVKETMEVVRDAKTGAFDANFPAGAEMARALAKSSNGKFMVFADVMDLGKTNYFRGGTQAGDLYLQRLSAAMKNQMRQGDTLFKNGGDELVVVLNTSDPKAVMDFQRRVHEAVAKDKVLQDLFKENRIAKAQAIPRGSSPTPQQIAELQDAARVRPGVAMGAARIKSSDASPWSNALSDADRQAGLVKAQAKAARGADISKYGNSATATGPRPRFDAPIPVLKPIE